MESKGNFNYVDSNGSLSKMQRDLYAAILGRTFDGADHDSRDMLRATVAAASRQIHVGIVGAGFAGLRCADLLLQHGVKVTMLEARDRVGGRVAQSHHLGHMVDLGPNWIHGTSDNPIMTLAKKTGTKLHAWDEAQSIIDVDGKPISAEEADEYGRLIWDDGVIAEAFKHSNNAQDSIDAHQSLYDFFVEKSKRLFVDESTEEVERKRETFLRVASFWGAYIGSPITRQSLRFYWLEECIEGENPFVAGTYQKILTEVAKRAQLEATIKLNCKVTSICSREAHGDGKPSVTVAGGSTMEFDELVVTTPLGWLKRNSHAFDPPLPTRLVSAIASIGYGCLDKVYITFPSAFWDVPVSKNHQPTSNSLDPAHTTPNVTATTTPIHQSPNGIDANHYPGFTQWLSPTYSRETNPEKWDQQCMNLAAMSSEFAHPTLLFYTYGPCSQHIGKLVAAAREAKEQDEKLRAFFEPYYSRLPNYRPKDPACEPKAFLATAWVNDEFAGYGSYSNFQVGLEKGDEDIETMRHGMPDRGIWFAGEHTAPFIALGTSTGAYWSGALVANRILKAYDVNVKPEKDTEEYK